MSLFFKKKNFFTADQHEKVIAAICIAEQRTSGEVRVFIEAKNPLMDPLERAAVIFEKLKMYETENRNAVLLYIAHKHKELALFGDKGIHEKLGDEYWHNEVQMMLTHFKKNELLEGIIYCINDIGEALHEKFPFIPGEDKNELSDDIIFGN